MDLPRFGGRLRAWDQGIRSEGSLPKQDDMDCHLSCFRELAQPQIFVSLPRLNCVRFRPGRYDVDSSSRAQFDTLSGGAGQRVCVPSSLFGPGPGFPDAGVHNRLIRGSGNGRKTCVRSWPRSSWQGVLDLLARRAPRPRPRTVR